MRKIIYKDHHSNYYICFYGMLKKQIFQRVKKLIPSISSTEMIALHSGTTSIDKQLFEGKVKPVDFKQLLQSPYFYWVIRRIQQYAKTMFSLKSALTN